MDNDVVKLRKPKERYEEYKKVVRKEKRKEGIPFVLGAGLGYLIYGPPGAIIGMFIGIAVSEKVYSHNAKFRANKKLEHNGDLKPWEEEIPNLDVYEWWECPECSDIFGSPENMKLYDVSCPDCETEAKLRATCFDR